jgi:hypothetical protein
VAILQKTTNDEARSSPDVQTRSAVISIANDEHEHRTVYTMLDVEIITATVLYPISVFL